MGVALPQNVYLMSFEPWKEGSFLIRFEHLLEKSEDPLLSKPVRFNLLDVFPGYDIDIQEVTLAANQWIGDYKRFHFNQETADFLDYVEPKIEKATEVEDLEISLNPMDIKTFIMTMNQRV